MFALLRNPMKKRDIPHDELQDLIHSFVKKITLQLHSVSKIDRIMEVIEELEIMIRDIEADEVGEDDEDPETEDSDEED
jgi:hypothetical protein